MNQKIWSGLTAALITTALTTTSSSHAEGTQRVEQRTQTNHLTISVLPSSGARTIPVDPLNVGDYQSETYSQTRDRQASNSTVAEISPPQIQAQNLDVIKEGEYQLRNRSDGNRDPIAKIESHQLAGRRAATLFVRDIPVLTFLGLASTNSGETKVGATGDGKDGGINRLTGVGEADLYANSAENSREQAGEIASTSDPVWRAAAVAAKLNQLNREAIDPNSIAVVWNDRNKSQARGLGIDGSSPESYIIQVNGEQLVEINADTRLPDTTNNLAEDALQVTNRLRRLMGDAPPLRDIAGRPAPEAKPIRIALTTRPVLSRITGVASWYGPGFHGNRSANGEIFNQNAFTAAHRNLPFGTQVKVTNLNNGLSVIVRINDRGPYARGRIIDLSAAAARTLGMMQTGVAPVTLEVLGRPETLASDQN